MYILMLVWFTLPVTAQTADFSADDAGVCPGSYINFTDLSTVPSGGTMLYTWNFPGAFPNTTNIQNPTIYYPTPGTYSVTLQVCEDGVPGSCDSEIKAGYITVHENPDAAFTFTIPDPCNGVTVNFTDISTAGDAAINTWFYDFGDGVGATTPNPIHSFPSVNPYEILFLITDLLGCQDDTLITVNPISVINNVVIVDSTLSCNGTPLLTTASAIASGGTGPYTYDWDFGNGNTASGPNVSETYSGCGQYDITLTTTDDAGCTSVEIFNDEVEIFCPTVDFTLSSDTICVGESLSVVDISNPVPSIVSWHFDPAVQGSLTGTPFPTYTYNTAGTYEITHCVRFSNGCEECVSKDVVVQAIPIAGSISILDSVACAAPFSALLSASGASGVGALNYVWYIGIDTFYGQTINPTISYEGSFDVTLEVYDETGCAGRITKSNLINIIPVEASFELSDVEGCAPLNITIANSSTAYTAAIDSFTWDMGDGNTFSSLTLDTFNYNYPAVGNYPIVLIAHSASGCNDTSIHVVQAGDVNAYFELEDTTVCGSVTLQNFTDFSDYTVVFWGNGDSTVLTDPLGDASYYYLDIADTASFQIIMVSNFNGCNDVHFQNVFVKAPIAFDRTITRDCSDPYTATIWVDPLVLGTSYCWDIGNGDTLCNTNPVTITFPGAGYYEVELIDTSSALLDTNCLEKTIAVAIVDFDPNMVSSNDYVCEEEIITFSNTNPDPTYDSIYWFFEIGPSLVNGITDTQLVYGDEYSRLFNIPDIYPVRIYTQDTSICNSEFLDTITVSGLTASFYIDSVDGCDPRTIWFADSSHTADTSLIPVTLWEWSFDYAGCPDYIGAIPPPCTYPTGTYEPSLRVQDGNGCVDNVIREITVGGGNFFAEFITEDYSCEDDSIRFINLSDGVGIAKYEWIFGDGDTSFLENPAHLYDSTGVYTVGLRLTDSAGCIDQVSHFVNSILSDIEVGFTIDYLSMGSCPPTPVELTDTSGGLIILQEWTLETQFGIQAYTGSTAVHSYLFPGVFDIQLVVTDAKSCKDSITIQDILIIPGPSADLFVSPDSGCPPLEVFFDIENLDATQAFIDFGNGDTLEIFGDYIYTYTDPGFYCPRMILLDSTGCETTYFCPTTISVFESPEADFELSDTVLCDGADLWITNLIDTTGWGTQFESIRIDFGDGATLNFTALFDSVSHTYATSGTFPVEITVLNEGGCEAINNYSVTISSNPLAELIFGSTSGCAPVSLSLDIIGLSADSAWLDYGDGNVSLVTGSVSHTYSTPG
ncbi:MAG: PKD repeat protein, partial [Limisphaerales bacterium]